VATQEHPPGCPLRPARIAGPLAAALALLVVAGCGGGGSSETATDTATPLTNTPPVQFSSGGASGTAETVNNIANLTVVSNDPDVLEAEYQAGFVQGHLQGRTVISARDNTLEPWHPGPNDLATLSGFLTANYDFMIGYLQARAGTLSGQRLTRLLFRMLGIYHGVTRTLPAALDFSGAWLPALATFQPSELVLNYQAPQLSFIDLYLVNAALDVEDVWYAVTGGPRQTTGRMKKLDRPWRCSAFVKRTADDVIIAHTSWASYLAQTLSMTIDVNGDRMTVNALTPGQIGSATDFGYNGRGLMFNETTHAYDYTEPRQNAVWIFWRAALAEQFAGSIDEFFDDIALDNSGTYLNGYMLVDAKTNETALVDMSYRTFVLFRSSGGAYACTTRPAGLATDYDSVMLTPGYIMGYNYPVSLLIRSELHSSYDSPRRNQLGQLLAGVSDVETAKTVITYHDPAVPGSIFGRFDLSDRPRPVGSIDAKVASASMARAFMRLSGTLDRNATTTGFWMLFGTAHIDDQPFIWSRSQWSSWSHPDVPDVLDGTFTHLPLHLR
jgi:hypothetical protein